MGIWVEKIIHKKERKQRKRRENAQMNKREIKETRACGERGWEVIYIGRVSRYFK